MATKTKPIQSFSEASVELLSTCLMEANLQFGQGNRLNHNESFSRNLPKLKILVVLGNDLAENMKIRVKHQLQKMVGESPVKIIEMGESITSMYSFTYKGNYAFYRSPQGETFIDDDGEAIYIAKSNQINAELLQSVIDKTQPNLTMVFSANHSYISPSFVNFVVKKEEITRTAVKSPKR